MIISTRTPDGEPNFCPVWGSAVSIEPSRPPGDAPCPKCGHLLWFAPVSVTIVELGQETPLGEAAWAELTQLAAHESPVRLLVDLMHLPIASAKQILMSSDHAGATTPTDSCATSDGVTCDPVSTSCR